MAGAAGSVVRALTAAGKIRPMWTVRTYAGHRDAATTNKLFRALQAHGETGFSTAFDNPTQLFLDPNDPRAFHEVGLAGVPIWSSHTMKELTDGINLRKANWSMTINASATAMLAMYVVEAMRTGVPLSALVGTTQNCNIKEYLGRGNYVFPPEASMRLETDLGAYTLKEVPNWRWTNVCGYHISETGAETDPVLEIAMTMEMALTTLRWLKPKVTDEEFAIAAGSITFFMSSGIDIPAQTAKFLAYSKFWPRLLEEEFGFEKVGVRKRDGTVAYVTPRFIYGLQVSSVNLTAQRYNLNTSRIVLEVLPAVLLPEARAASIQLPTETEAHGLPTQQQQEDMLAVQHIIGVEAGILSVSLSDIFSGAPKLERTAEEYIAVAREKMRDFHGRGGLLANLQLAKGLLEARAAQTQREIEAGERLSVGVNDFRREEGAVTGLEFLRPDPAAMEAERRRYDEFVRSRDSSAVDQALGEVERVAGTTDNVMPSIIAAVQAGATVGELGARFRNVFGEMRPLQ